jgi:hypothetical protein
LTEAGAPFYEFKVARVNGLFGYQRLAKRVISASLDKNLQ